MAVKTITRIVSQNDDDDDNGPFIPIEIIATIPNNDDDNKNNKNNNNKIPISITLRNVNDSKELSKLQCYHYAILNRHSSNDIIDIPLLDTNNDWISEITRKIAILLVKKTGKPCYVSWSSSSTNSNEMASMDQLFILKNCINLLNSLIN